MCTVLLPPGVNPIAVKNKYIFIQEKDAQYKVKIKKKRTLRLPTQAPARENALNCCIDLVQNQTKLVTCRTATESVQ
jgi:hypothetical protein